MVEDRLVAQGREHARDGGLAGLAAPRVRALDAVLGDDVLEGVALVVEAQQRLELGHRLVEVGADAREDRRAELLELRGEDLLHVGLAAAAAGARARALLDRRVVARVADLRDDVDDVAARHAVAGADLLARVVLVDLGGGAARRQRREEQRGRVREGLAALPEREELAVVLGVADEDAALEVRRAVARLEEELAVDAADAVVPDEGLGRVRRVAEVGDVAAEQLELRRHVRALEGRRRRRARVREEVRDDAVRGDLGHGVARRDEAVDGPPVERDLADGEDGRVRRPQLVVDDDAAALVDVDDVARELVAGADARGDDDDAHVEVVPALVRERHALHAAVRAGLEGLGPRVAVDLEAQVLDHGRERRVAAGVDLAAHEDGRVLEDVGLHAEVVHRLGRLEAQEPAADDGRSRDAVRLLVRDEALEVVDGPVDEDALEVRARDGRHEGVGPRRQDAGVVGHRLVAAEDRALLDVEARRPVADADQDVPPRLVLVPLLSLIHI